MVDTLVGQRIEEEETLVVDTPETEQETTEEELDPNVLKERAEAAEARVAQLERDKRSQEIQLRTRQERDARDARMEAMLEDLLTKRDSGVLDETQYKAAVKKGISDIEEEVAALPSDVSSWMPGVVQAEARIRAEAEQRGWDMNSDEFASIRDPWEIGVRYQTQKGREGLAKTNFDLAIARFDLKVAQAGTATGGTQQRNGLSLNARGQRGAAAGMNDQAVWEAYGRGDPNVTWERARTAGRRLGITE